MFYTRKIPKFVSFTREKRVNRDIFAKHWEWKMFYLSIRNKQEQFLMFMMIKSLHNQCVLPHRGDIMIHDEYADDFDDMVSMMFMMMISLHNLVHAPFPPMWHHVDDEDDHVKDHHNDDNLSDYQSQSSTSAPHHLK